MFDSWTNQQRMGMDDIGLGFEVILRYNMQTFELRKQHSHKHILHCPYDNTHFIYVITHLALSGNKTLPEPILTKF